MEEFKWIEEISDDKVKVLRLLRKVDKTLPTNFVNAFHKRRDLIIELYEEAEEIHGSVKNHRTVEYFVIERVVGRLSYIHKCVTQLGVSTHKDRWFSREMKNSLRNLRKASKKFSNDIVNGDDTLWWFDAGTSYETF